MILLTGASGFVGAHFLAELLYTDPAARAAAIMRPGHGRTPARTRLEAALARALHTAYRTDRRAQELADRVQVLEGDLTREGCGLDAARTAWLRATQPDQLWHLAADLRALSDPERAQANVAAARNVAALAAEIGCPHLVQVSTAYVYGRAKAVAETGFDPSVEPLPNNAYERSKFDAEQAVRKLCAEPGGPALTLIRPTVIVGHSETKAAGGSASGLYGVIRRLEAEVRRRGSRAANRLVLHYGTGRVNLVPIDRVVAEMMATARADAPPADVATRVVAGTDVDVATIVRALEDRLGVAIGRAEDSDQVPEADRPIDRRLACFAPYTAADNAQRFGVGEVAERYKIYDVDVLNLVEAGRREAMYGTISDLLRLRTVPRRQHDGAPMAVYESAGFEPSARTAVLVNAYGMPVDALHPLAHALVQAGFNVLSWDCRGLPDQAFRVTAGELGIDGQLDDWDLLQRTYGLDRVDLVGWSTGAVVASAIAARRPEAVNSLVLLHGSYMHAGAELTQFQSNLKSIMPKVAAGRGIAKVLYQSVFAENKSFLLRHATRGFKQKSEEAMDVTPPALKHLVEMLTRGPEEVFRYARLIQAFIAEDPRDWFADIRCPVMLVTGDADRTAHPAGTYELAQLHPNARTTTIKGGDHFSFYSLPAARRHVLEAIGAAPERSPKESAQQ